MTDVPFTIIPIHPEYDRTLIKRVPIGVGLVVGACVSVALAAFNGLLLFGFVAGSDFLLRAVF